jgi:hypothetical protein
MQFCWLSSHHSAKEGDAKEKKSKKPARNFQKKSLGSITKILYGFVVLSIIIVYILNNLLGSVPSEEGNLICLKYI